MFTPEQVKELEAPLSKANVKRNPRGFDYVEAWHAENEANRIFGFSAWDRFTDAECIGEREVDGKMRVYYRAKVRIVVRSEGEVTVREGCGYGSGIDKDLGGAHESALKEAESDAEKRALKTFGNPFGQALYDKTQANVAEPPTQRFTMAAKALREASDGPAFQTFWERNKAPLKEGLPPHEYAELVAIMRAEAARFAPAKEAA